MLLSIHIHKKELTQIFLHIYCINKSSDSPFYLKPTCVLISKITDIHINISVDAGNASLGCILPHILFP